MDSKDSDLTYIDMKMQELEELAEVVRSLQNNPNHDPAELELLIEEVKKRGRELEPFLRKAKQEVDDRLILKSTAFYYDVKMLAESGDREAMEVFQSLRFSFAAYLCSRINLN